MERLYHEEGIQIADQEGFVLLNMYFPKKKDKKLLISRDPDKARKKIDLARPKENEKTSGFLPGEGARIYKFISRGCIDTWTALRSKPGYWTWWDLESRAR